MKLKKNLSEKHKKTLEKIISNDGECSATYVFILLSCDTCPFECDRYVPTSVNKCWVYILNEDRGIIIEKYEKLYGKEELFEVLL